MSIAFPFNSAINVTRDQVSDLLHGKNVYQFSCFEQFIDFFREIFTGKSNIEDYYKMHQLLCRPQKRDISVPYVNCGDVTNWRTVVGVAKLIDASKSEAIDRYSVDFKRQENDIVTINMNIDGITLAEFECITKDFEFLKENFFNENNKKIKFTSDFYSTFQAQLSSYLLKDMRDGESQSCEINNNNNTEGCEPLLKNNASSSCPQPDIERFIDAMSGSLSKSDLAGKTFIGQGSYGKVYLFDEGQEKYVVKIPINELGKKIDCNSDEHQNAHPERVSHYLNLANIDPDFSRHMKITYDGQLMDVLVSKYISGNVFDTNDDDNFNRSFNLLEERGLLMHDINVEGNVFEKGGELYFVDGDQIVISQAERRKRRVSQATKQLEEQIKAKYDLGLHQAKLKENSDDIKYFSVLVDEHNELINTAVEVGEIKKKLSI